MNVPYAQQLLCPMSPHCATCRDMAGGRSLRESISKQYPDFPVDFDCPYGRPWGLKAGSVKVVNPLAQKSESAEDIELKVRALTLDTVENKQIYSLVLQNLDLRDQYRNRGESCKARRCEQKIVYLWHEYELTQQAVASSV